jgi:antitoxin ParD1/3/4
MMTTVNISLPETLKDFLDEEVKHGGYSTTSEYLRTLIRQAQKQKAQEVLETQLLGGLASGQATAMTSKDWQAIRQEVKTRVDRAPQH